MTDNGNNGNIFEDKRVYWVWISLVMGAGNPAVWELCRGYKHINDFAEALKGGEFDESLSARQKKSCAIPFEKAAELIAGCEERGVQVLCFRSEGYPDRLRRIPNPPHVLFVRGNLKLLSETRGAAAFVGTRAPTAYSVRTAERLSAELVERGVTVLTGLEAGIDSVAAEAACEAGCAAGVLGRGIFGDEQDNVLIGRTAERGVLIAEYTSAREFGKMQFDRRNRLLCGLADAVVFIECRADSAGLNNAGHASRYGRPIFVLPPSDIGDPRFFGQRDLIRVGAAPLFSSEDILRGINAAGRAYYETEAIAEISKRRQHKKTAAKPIVEITENAPDNENIKNEQKNTDEGLHKSEMSATIDISGLSAEQRKIYEALKENGEVHLNRLAELTELDMTELISELSFMRIDGIVTELSGKRYCLC